jgi:hypothetical protein
MTSPNTNQLQSMAEKTRNALSLKIHAFETKIYNIEQHTEQYIKLIDKQTILHQIIQNLTDEIEKESQNLTDEIEKESTNNNIYTVISDLEDKKAELVLEDKRIKNELTNLRPYMVKYAFIKEKIPSYRETVIRLKTKLHKIQMKQMYLEYLENESNWCNDDDRQIVKSILDGTSSVDPYEFCNRNHHIKLLNEFYFAPECKTVSCNEKFDNILEFDITSTVPMGHVIKNW